MSNLGLYQEITTAAKAAGGVEDYIKSIERGVAPKYGALGFMAGVGATLGIAYVLAWAEDRKMQAALAKAELREETYTS